MTRTWIRQLFARPTSPLRRPRFNPQLHLLESRDVPTAFFVSPGFNGTATDIDGGTPGIQVDGDLVLAGDQVATVGVDAFDTIPAATALAVAFDTILINAGDYTANGAVSLALPTPTTFQGASVKVASLDVSDAGALLTLNAPLTTGGDNTSTTIASSVGGTNGFVKIGTGKLTLSQANTFTGVTTVSAGTLAVTANDALGAVGAANNTVVASGATVEVSGLVAIPEAITLDGSGVGGGGALRHTGVDTSDWAGPITLAGTGARINSDAGGLFIVSGLTDGTGKALTLGGAGDITYSGKINTLTGGTIIKDGAGRANLTNDGNTFGTGAVAASVVITINGGILAQNGEFSATAGTATSSGVIPSVTVPSYVLLNGGTLQGTRVGLGVTFLATPKGITLGANGGGLDVADTTNGNLNIYTGIVSGTLGGALTRSGAANSVLAMAGASTYNGATNVTGGIFRVRTSANRFPIATNLTVANTADALFDLNGVGQQVATITGGVNSRINLGTVSQVLTVGDASNFTWDGYFSGAGGSIIKVGTGNMTLTNGTSSNTGTSAINAGTLTLANATGTALGTGGATIASGATLTNINTAATQGVVGTVTANGTLSPGGATGTNIFNTGAFTMSATGTLAVNLFGTTPGNGTNAAAAKYDQIVTTGGVSLNNGKLTVDTTGATINLGDVFTIIDNGPGSAITSIFNQLPEGATITSTGGHTFKISYTSGGTNDVTLTAVAPGKTFYVKPTFNAGATDIDGATPGIQVDGDLVTAGNQVATVGVDAFASINAAYALTVDNDSIIINAGTYTENVAFDKVLKVTFQEAASTVTTLAGNNASNILIFSGVNVQFGDATATTYAGLATGSGGFTFAGTGGSFTLTGLVNSYTGATTVSAGTLINGALNGLSTASPLTLSASGRFKLNGFSATVANLTGVAGSIVENESANNAVISAGSAAVNVSYLGTLQDGVGGGNLGFVKLGTGTLTLPAVNTFTGPFTLQGGSYSVATFPNGGVAGPFGASDKSAANLTIRTTSTLTYTGPSTTTDRNISWGIGTINVATAATTLTIGGTLTRVDPTAGSTFTKSGPGTLAFPAADAFQTPNDIPNSTYGINATGNVTVSAGNLSVVNFRVNGTTRPGGSRIVTIATGATMTTTGTVTVDPTGTYTAQIVGPGTLQLRKAGASKTAPTIEFDNGPAGGNGSPFGTIISAVLDVGTVPAVFVGKGNRNNIGRYSGDARFDGAFSGSASIQFTGLSAITTAGDPDTNNKFNMAYALNADNTAFTGAVLIANANLSLGGNTNRLSANNSVTFNSFDDTTNTTNTAGLYLWGRGHTIGSLNDLSDAATTAFIRNGSLTGTNGLTNTLAAANSVALGSNTDAALIITQTTPGTFKGVIGNGPNDLAINGAAGTAKLTGITKTGPATLTFTGTSLYSNSTNLSAGTLIVDGSIATSAGLLTAAGTTLGGNGTIPVSAIAAKVTGGTDGTAGKLNTSSNFVLNSTGTLVVDVTGNGTVAGTDYDQINVTGAVTITGSTLSIVGTGTPAAGTPLVIINNDLADAVVGKFTNAPNEGDTITVGLNKFAVSYIGGDGNDVTLTRQSGVATATGFIVNGGAAQRSRITQIEVLFSGAVSAATYQNIANAITLTRTIVSTPATGALNDVVATGPITNNNRINVAQGTATSLILTFNNAGANNTVDVGVENGSLSDGFWQLNVGSFTSGLNDLNLRRLYGDSTATVGGQVSGDDFLDFGNFFNSNDSRYDFDNDGSVGGSDALIFGNRFGRVL